jgi:UDP-2-acetamido-3-amino-2,3-dideoxy-glucuronate N-acetyltransferase
LDCAGKERLGPVKQLQFEKHESEIAASDFSGMTGNPAGPFNQSSPPAQLISRAPVEVGATATTVAGVTLHRMPYILDPRGPLSFGEIGEQVPFEVQRYFLVFDVSSEEIRGEHAHRELHQFLICVHGCCHLTADDGRHREDFILDHPSIGVHLPPMVWGVQHKYTRGAVLLVLASAKYDPADYIRSYAAFLELVQGTR